MNVGTMAPASNAAALLWRLWSEGRSVPALPAALRPVTCDDGWAIQRALDDHAGPPAGWKLAATSAAGQALVGADGPLAGRIYRRCVAASGAQLDAAALTMRVAEPEFAFRIVRDIAAIGSPVTREGVLAAVGALMPAVEVPDSRFDDYLAVGLPSMLADGLCCGFLVLGDDVEDWDPDDLPARPVALRRNGEVVAEGTGANVLGDPVAALVWLARHLHDRGAALRAGDVVTTGACTIPHVVRSGDEIVADFGDLGQVQVAFRAA